MGLSEVAGGQSWWEGGLVRAGDWKGKALCGRVVVWALVWQVRAQTGRLADTVVCEGW